MKDNVLLETRGLVKKFGGLVAVNGVGFSIGAGEILGLLGPNGSGKSTVMKLIMGIEKPTAGEVYFEGSNIAGWPSHRVARAGIGMVFQHSRPLHRQTVLENIKLAALPDSLLQIVAHPAIDKKAQEVAERVGLGDVLHKRPATLPFADLRRMEMAKVIAQDPRVILVDEPFAGLAPDETESFADLIRSFRDDGRAVLLVDHNVKSVVALADRAYAMYLGEPVIEGTATEVVRSETVRQVYLGGEIESTYQNTVPDKQTEPILEVKDLAVLYGKAQALSEVSVRIDKGQFISVIGLNGAGKTTLFNAICGIVPYQGEIEYSRDNLKGKTVGSIARSGIVQCPETRELFNSMTVRENLDLGGAHLPASEKTEQISRMFELFPILKERQGQAAGTLSGGEQQMLAIARALMMQPKLLILDEPTLGLAPVILEQLSKAMDQLRETSSITILLGEQNVTFALSHADRVYVLERSRITWEGQPRDFAEEMGESYL